MKKVSSPDEVQKMFTDGSSSSRSSNLNKDTTPETPSSDAFDMHALEFSQIPPMSAELMGEPKEF